MNNRNKVHLIFGCHCHQPLGNFEDVIERIYAESYLPFVETLLRHPKIKVVIHYSGVLFDWLGGRHPEFFKLLGQMIQGEQAEILTGSYYEAILPVIPEPDQLEQIRRLSHFISSSFQTSPQGMWLAERVWEPKLAKTLPEAGMKFSLVDDFHFKSAGLKEKDLLGYFNTEEEGSLFSLFPISERLRYLTPFQNVEDTIQYLQHVSELYKNPLLVIVDDGEKFGSWPGTKKWVYEDGWLERFLEALEENSSWIETTTCSEYLQSYPASGLVYLPIGSYFNMGEWALSAESAADYMDFIEKLKHDGLLDRYKGFLRGGIWRNFLTKYPETNHLHKKMAALSRSIYTLETQIQDNPEHTKNLALARTELLKGQCNDGYWHGVFGGIYLPHLREALYRSLIHGERLVESIIHHGEQEWCEAEIFDFDGDGRPEIVLNSPWLKAYFDPGEGGSMVELDYKPRDCNIINTLARRFEHYHLALRKTMEDKTSPPASEHTSIHDIKKTDGLDRLKDLIVYDRSRKTCLLDHVFSRKTGALLLQTPPSEQSSLINTPYEFSVNKKGKTVKLTLKNKALFAQEHDFPLEIAKVIRIVYNKAALDIQYSIMNMGGKSLKANFGVEWNFSLSRDVPPEVTSSYSNKEQDSNLRDASGRALEVTALRFLHQRESFSLLLQFEKRASLVWSPIETISKSEKGFDLTYQGTQILSCWKIDIPPGKQWTAGIKFSIIPV